MNMISRIKSLGFWIGSLLAGAGVALLIATPMSADAVIHEIVAAYCSGGDHGVINENGELLPPGMLRDGQSFARPVIASGAVDESLETTDMPNTKYPEGTHVTEAHAENSNHPSAAHCPNVADLP